MRRERNTERAQIPTIVIVVGLLAASLTAGAVALAAGGTTVSITPADSSVDVGEETTYTVVVDNADGGVGAGEVGLAVDDPSVATITDVEVLGSGSTDVNIAGDGSSADVYYAFRDTDDDGTVSIIEVTVEGQADGTTGLWLEPAGDNEAVLLFDEEGTGYHVTGTNSASLTVEDGASTPEPATPTPEPATPTPEPATPTPEPATPTPEPATPTPEPEPAPETKLHLDPSSANTQPGKTTTYDVVVGNANGGVGAGEMAIVLGDSSVATITEVTVLGSGEEEIDIAENGSRADVNYAARDTYDSGSFSIIEVTVEGQSYGETSLSLAAANGSDALGLFDEQGTAYDVTGTTGATVTVKSGGSSDPDPTPTPTPEPPEEPDYFQIDLVEGEVLQQLDPDQGDTYHKQDRFIIALMVSEDEDLQGGPGTPMDRTYQSDGCEVAFSWLSFDSDTGESQVAVSVSDVGGCEGITLSYAGYELPDGTTGWDQDRADEQELKDSVTVTLESGDEEVLTVDVTPEETSSAPASLRAPAGIGR